MQVIHLLAYFMFYLGLSQLAANAIPLTDHHATTSTTTSKDGTAKPTQTIAAGSSSTTPNVCHVKRGKPEERACKTYKVPWHIRRIFQEKEMTWDSLPRKADDPFDDHSELCREMSEKRYKMVLESKWGKDVIVYTIGTGVEAGGFIPFSETGDVTDSLLKTAWAKANKAYAKPRVDNANYGTGYAALISGLNQGIARQATIFPIKVTNNEDRVEQEDIREGIELAIHWWRTVHSKAKSTRAIITIPWRVGSSRLNEKVIKKAIDAEMHIVMSAGNEGENMCHDTVRDLGQIIVGGMSVNSVTFNERLSLESNEGPCIDIMAPSAWLPFLDIHNKEFVPKNDPRLATALVTSVLAAALSLDVKEYRDKPPRAARKYFMEDFAYRSDIVVPKGTTQQTLVADRLWNNLVY